MNVIGNKKILYVAGSHLPTPKAFGYQTVQMCQAFEEVGRRVCLSFPIATELDSKDKLRSYYNLRKNIEVRPFRVPNVLRMLTKFNLRSRLFQVPAFYLITALYMLKLAAYVRRHQLEISYIYFRDFNLLWLFLIFSGKNSASKLCFEVHSLPKSLFKRSLQVHIIKRLKKIICLTYASKEILKSRGVLEANLSVSCDGVDIDNFSFELDRDEARRRSKIAGDDIILLYLGRFHTNGMEKGIPEIIRSAKFLKEKSGVKYLFVGGPMDQVRKYKKIIEDERLDAGLFEFRDKVPVAEVPIYLQAADVLLMPHPGGVDFYSYFVSPLKLFEYMAAGKPIVASDLPAIREILTNHHNAILCEPGNVQNLASGIDWLLTNKDKAHVLGATAKKEAWKYSWRNRAKSICTFLFVDTQRIDQIQSVHGGDA